MADKRKERKQTIIQKVYNELGNYKQVIMVSLVNIDTNQVNEIRKYFRKNKIGSMIIGKNTVIQKAINMRIKGLSEDDKKAFPNLKEHNIPQVEALLKHLAGKVGLIFSDVSVSDFKKAITKTPISREAKVGSIAPCDVIIKEGPTGLQPAEVNFFHALGIPVKINKGILDLQKDIHIIKKGDKVGNSEASLLKKLNLKPFTYPLEFLHVYEDGKIYPAHAFDTPVEDVLARIQANVKYFSALSVEAGHVNSISAPQLISNTFKYMLALATESKYPLEALKQVASAPVKEKAPAKEAPKPEAKKPEPKKEEAPPAEEDFGMGGLFD